MSKYWAYITALFGTLGVAGLMLIPGAAAILTAVVTAATPILKGFSELLVWFVKTCWEGFVDIIDNTATILTVTALVAGFSAYYKYYSPERTACEKEIVLMQEQIKQLKAKVRSGR